MLVSGTFFAFMMAQLRLKQIKICLGLRSKLEGPLIEMRLPST